MNRAEMQAITTIANKLGWMNKPVVEVIETVNQMVRNQQCLELDTVGECDDSETVLLSLATWNVDKILSTRLVYDYETLIGWRIDIFCEDMGIDYITFRTMKDYYSHSAELLAPEYEEEEMAKFDAECDAWENSYC